MKNTFLLTLSIVMAVIFFAMPTEGKGRLMPLFTGDSPGESGNGPLETHRAGSLNGVTILFIPESVSDYHRGQGYETENPDSDRPADVRHDVPENSNESCDQSITITKVVIGVPPLADWQFSSDIPGHASFTLPAAGGSITFNGLAIGTYHVTETTQPGYSVVTSCSGSGATATMTLSACCSVSCDFLSMKDSCKGRITIRKSLYGTAPATAWNYTSDIPGHASFSIPASGGDISFTDLDPGNYQVTEVVKTGYTVTNSCGTGNVANISVTECCSVGCEFVNVLNTCKGKITIRKTLLGTAPASAWSFTSNIPGHSSFSIAAGGGDITFTDVDPGSYQVTEVLKTDYNVSNSCGTANLANIAVLGCDSVACEFINVQNACKGKITIRKTLQGSAPATAWNFTSNIPGHTSFTIPAGGGDITFTDVNPGSYQVSEVMKAGYAVTNTCGTDNVASITVLGCDSLGCEFVNTCKGKITIRKTLQGSAPATAWNFTSNIPGHASFSLPAGGGYVTFTDVNPGSYQVTEVLKSGYSVTNTCGTANVANINLTGCDSLGCEFVNTCKGKITIRKTLQGSAPATAWNFTSNIPGHTSFTLPAGGGDITFTDVALGSYQVTEVSKAGYSVTNTCGSGNIATINLIICDSLGCEFVNTCKGKITIRKTLQGPAPATNWDFTSNIPGHASFSIPAGGGDITFTDVNPGNYQVTELSKAGYTVTNSCGTANVANINLTGCDSLGCEFLNVCNGKITISKSLLGGPAPSSAWQFTSNIPGHTSFTLPAGGGSVTFSGIPGGNYQITETPVSGYTVTNTCGTGNTGNIVLANCDSVGCTFNNVQAQAGCLWCNKPAILSQVWQNMCDDTCAIPDIIVDLRLGSTTIDVTKIGTTEPATGSLQAAVDYINLNGNLNGDCGLFIGVIATDCDSVYSPRCHASGSRPPASDAFSALGNVVITNTRPERLNIFGCNVTLQAANAALPVITIQNSVGKVTVLDIHVKGSNVAGYLVKNNADLVIVKSSRATSNKLGYDIQDNEVEITQSPQISNNETGILVQGGPGVILRTNNNVRSNSVAGIRITGNGNETNGNSIGSSGFPNTTGMIVTGSSNNIHDDVINYNTNDGLSITGNGNTAKGEDANYNGGYGIRVDGNRNWLDANRLVKFNGLDGFYVTGDTNNLTGNEGSNNSGHGIHADIANGATGNTLRSNAANDNGIQGIRACGQIDNGSNSGSGNLIDPQVVFNCIPVSSAKFTVVDINTDKAYKYDATFNLISGKPLNASNTDPDDAYANGTASFVLDNNDFQIYRYVSSPAASRVLKEAAGTSLSSPTGMAIDGDDLWIADESKRKLYRYSLSAAFTGTGNLNALQEIVFTSPNANVRGLAIDASNLYVLDNSDKQFYSYPRAGGAGTASKVLKNPTGSSLNSPSGAVLDGATMWIVDNGTDNAYSYDFSILFGSGNINASGQFSLYNLNANATGIEAGSSVDLY